MDLSFILYVLASIIVVSGTFYYSRSAQRNVQSVVMSILFLCTAIFFGLRWFTTSGSRIIKTNLSKTWPPPNSINVCPDFLSLRSDVDGAKKTYYCVDPLGVSITANGLQQWSSSASTAKQYQLGTVTTASGSTPAKSDWLDVNTLCKNASSMGLTWEGVCSGGTVVLAPGTSLPLPV
jgi:hypothetical protein